MTELNTSEYQEFNTQNSFIASIMGPHAGESVQEIFTRKQADIDTCGYTLWVCYSQACVSPTHIQTFCFRENTMYFVIVESSAAAQRAKKSIRTKLVNSSSSHTMGVKQTNTAEKASMWSQSREELWNTLPPELSHVTGRLTNKKGDPIKNTCTFVIDKLIQYPQYEDKPLYIELDQYNMVVQGQQKPIVSRQGMSTWPIVKRQSHLVNDEQKLTCGFPIRRVLALARLKLVDEPNVCVYVK